MQTENVKSEVTTPMFESKLCPWSNYVTIITALGVSWSFLSAEKPTHLKEALNVDYFTLLCTFCSAAVGAELLMLGSPEG